MRWSNTVCAALREPGPMPPSRIFETLANRPAAGPALLRSARQSSTTPRARGGSRWVVEIRWTSAAAVMSLAAATGYLQAHFPFDRALRPDGHGRYRALSRTGTIR